MEILYRIKTHIRKGRIEEALDLLDEILQRGDKNLYKDFILLNSDYSEQRKRESKGLEWDPRVDRRVKDTIIEIVDTLLDNPETLPTDIQYVSSTPSSIHTTTPDISIAVPMAFDYASDLEKARHAHDNADFNTAITLLSKYQDKLEGEGCGILGWAYVDDRNPQNDYTNGILMLEKGIKKGDPLSHYILGLMNYNGLAMAENNAAALKLFEKTLDLADENSEEYINSLPKLGVLYFDGLGTKKNIKKGLEFFKTAADKDNGEAMNVLARIYYAGTGVDEDTDEALEYAELAAEHGFIESNKIAGCIYFIREDYDSAVPHLETAAADGFADAQFFLGRMYEDGLAVEQNTDTAIELYKKALEGEQYSAANNLGRMYLDGDGVPIDYTKAYHYFEKAHEAGVGMASYNLGFMYKNGLGVDKNKLAAESYFKIAVLKGYQQAQVELDSMKGFWGLFS